MQYAPPKRNRTMQDCSVLHFHVSNMASIGMAIVSKNAALAVTVCMLVHHMLTHARHIKMCAFLIGTLSVVPAIATKRTGSVLWVVNQVLAGLAIDTVVLVFASFSLNLCDWVSKILADCSSFLLLLPAHDAHSNLQRRFWHQRLGDLRSVYTSAPNTRKRLLRPVPANAQATKRRLHTGCQGRRPVRRILWYLCGGWTRVYSNTFFNNHHGITYNIDCPCGPNAGMNNGAKALDGNGWHLGVTNCHNSNKLSGTIGGKTSSYSWCT